MTKLRLVALFLLVMTAAMPAVATCDGQDQPTLNREIEAYLKNKKPALPRANILGFDHKNQRWTAYHWDGTYVTESKDLLDRRLSERPRFFFDASPTVVLVYNTNPVVFRAAQSESTQMDGEALASLTKFLSAAGGFLTTGVTGIAQGMLKRTPGVPAIHGIDGGGDRFQMLDAELHTTKLTPSEELTAIVGLLDIRMATLVKGLGDDLHYKELQADAANLKKQGAAISAAAAQVASIAQLAELGGDVRITRPVIDANLATSVDDALTKLRADLNALPSLPCADIVSALRALIIVELEGFSSDRLLRNRAQADFNKVVDELVSPDCHDDEQLRHAVSHMALWLRANPPKVTIPDDDIREQLMILLDQTSDYLAAQAGIDAAVAKSKDLLDKQKDAVGTSAGVVVVARRIADVPDSPCAFTNGVIEVSRPQHSNAALKFGQEGQETFKLAPDPAFDKITFTHAQPLDPKFALARKAAFDPDFDVALTYTKLADPSFELEAHDDVTPKTYTVRQTKRTTKAGQIALMMTLHYVPWSWTKVVAPQIGFLASTGNAGVFLGGAIQPLPYLKVSAGSTWQQVTALPHGWTVDQITPKGEATLQTRNRFGHRMYIALSITLDNLSLFKSP
jgi:hypothetical protein